MDEGRFINALLEGRVPRAPDCVRKNRERGRLSCPDFIAVRLVVWSLVAQFFVLLAGPLGAQGAATLEEAAAQAISAGNSSNNPAVVNIVTPTAADTALPVLTQITQIRDLSAREASRGYPVRVTGIVTYYDPPAWQQFLQDDSAGIYFRLPTTNFTARLGPGQKVQIEGFSGPGEYAPVLAASRISVMGDGSFPPAKISTVQSLMTGSEDSQWVAIKGVVRSQTVTNDKTVLMLWTAGASIRATVPHAADAPAPLDFLDATVEVHGVCSTLFNQHRRLQGIELNVPDWKQVEVHEMGPKDPFTLPIQPISALLEFHAGTSGLHRSRIDGIVTLRRSDGSFFVQDASGGMLVQINEPTSKIQAGMPMEIVGFPTVSEELPVLQDAIARPLGHLPPIEPLHLKPESHLDGDLHATLVQFDGRVIAHTTRLAEELLTVQFAQSVTDAILEKEARKVQLAKILPGSVVHLTGVYVAQLDDSRKARSFRLLLRSPADVVLISRPPWWTLRNTFWVLGGLTAVLSGALMWVGLLRKEVRRRTRELCEEVEGHRRTETKLEQESRLLLFEVEQRKHAQAELEERQAALKKEIDERTQAEEQLKETHKQLLVLSRQAGMAEVATSVLHNVGNVLTSVNVSTGVVTESVKKSRASSLGRVVALLQEHAQDLGAFITNDSRGKHVPAHLAQLAEHLQAEQEANARELDLLRRNVDHIKEIVAMQQNYARFGGVKELVNVVKLVEDSLRMNEEALNRHGVEVMREFEEVPPLNVEKHKILQILVNLLRNAKHACDASPRADKRLTVRVVNGESRIKVSVIDNGVGIPPENLSRIFSHGFTTRKDGHGFGLHSGALAAREMGGSLTVHSDGPGQGAVFTLELPCPTWENHHE